MSSGLDTWCTDRLRTGRYATKREIVVQAAFRRLTTPRGMLAFVGGDEEANYGLDVASYVGSLGTDQALSVLPAVIRGELLKDDRLVDVDVQATREDRPDGTSALTVEIGLDVADEAEPASLTLSISEVDVEILGGTAN